MCQSFVRQWSTFTTLLVTMSTSANSDMFEKRLRVLSGLPPRYICRDLDRTRWRLPLRKTMATKVAFFSSIMGTPLSTELKGGLTKSTSGHAKHKLSVTPACPAAIQGEPLRQVVHEVIGGSTPSFTTWMICTRHAQELYKSHEQGCLVPPAGVAPGQAAILTRLSR